MKKASRRRSSSDRDTMRPEYDFSNGVRGAVAKRYGAGTNVMVIDPEVLDVFPDSKAVNEALRALAPVLRKALLAALVVGPPAAATPLVNSAVIRPRVINNCPGSSLTSVNNFAASIVIDDARSLPPCPGVMNMHVWRFSDDGATPAVFNNRDSFRICTDLVATGGAGGGTAGLQISPSWAQDTEGLFEVSTLSGFIYATGGRLPYFEFTRSGDPAYQLGTPIHLEMVYSPSAPNFPAKMEYRVRYNNVDYTSGPLPFGGIGDDARVGGHFVFDTASSGQYHMRAEWSNICFEALTVDVAPKMWQQVKSLYR